MKRLALAAAIALLAAAPMAHAAPPVPYDQTALAAAQAAGKPILIAVHATWCPVCAKQDPIIRKLAVTPAFKDMVIMIVDFDAQKDVVRALDVQKQSTLIVMNGKTERDRSTGVSDEAAITALLSKANG